MSLAFRVARHWTQKHGCATGCSFVCITSPAALSTQQLLHLRGQQQQFFHVLRMFSTSNEPMPERKLQESVTPKPGLKGRIITPRSPKLVYDNKMKWEEKPKVPKLEQELQPPKKPPVSESSKIKKSVDDRKKEKKDWQGYVFHRYFDYVKNYDKVLEKNFPRAISVYRVFFEGVTEFFSDMKRYLTVARLVANSPQGMGALIRRDLELYRRMPHDMIKVAPALIGCALPMVGYAFFPLVFMFPRQFLTSHFWTLQQRAEFQQYYIKQRLLMNKPVLRSLQAKLKLLKKHPQHACFEQILGQIGSGTHPSVEQLLEVKDIFAEGPLSLQGLSRKQIKQLVKLNEVGVSFFKRFRLREHAFMIHLMDLAIMREGHPHNMDTDSLRYSCYLRGLNPSNLTKEEMVEWLRNWIKVSMSIQEQHISLFLHLPVLLGYNHPNNWQLIYSKKEMWKTGDDAKK